MWAVALQAHVWSIPDAELRRLRGDSRVSFVPSARGVHARGARRDGDDDDDDDASMWSLPVRAMRCDSPTRGATDDATIPTRSRR